MAPMASKSQHWWTDLLLLCLLVGSLFTFMLGSRPLNVPDEARYCEIPREMLVTHHFITPRINGIKYFEKPPLFYWIQAASLKTFGFSEWGCRAADALIALLGCLATYGTARCLFDRKTGWLATLILSSSLLYFSLARVVTLDMTVSILITLTLYAILLGLQRPPDNLRRLLFYVAYAFAALAVLTKGLIGILFPGTIVLLWLIMTGKWYELKYCYLPTGLLLFLAIALPWHILIQQHHPEFFHYYFIRQQFARYLTNVAGRYQPDWYYLPILLLGLFPWTGFLYGALKHREQENPAVGFLGIWALFILAFFSLSHSKLVPYILPTLPPLAILIAHYLSKENKPTTAGWIGWGTMATISVALCIALPLWLTPAVTINYADAYFWARIVMTTLIITIIIIPLIYKKWGFMPAFISQFIASVAFLFGVCATLPYISMDSIKPLALTIKPLLTPNAMVATYDYYYQDLPFYLRRDVSIVNWKGELEFGAKHEPHLGNLMINSATLWQHWQSPQSVYLFTPKDMWKELQKKVPYHFYLLASTKNDVVLTNHRMATS